MRQVLLPLGLLAVVGCGDDCYGVTPHELHIVGDDHSPPPCDFDLDCPDEWACEAEECVPICGTDADCPGAQRCEEGRNTEALVCVGPLLGRVPRDCSFDTDCANDHACDAHRCRVKCVDDDECPERRNCAKGRISTDELVCRYVAE